MGSTAQHVAAGLAAFERDPASMELHARLETVAGGGDPIESLRTVLGERPDAVVPTPAELRESFRPLAASLVVDELVAMLTESQAYSVRHPERVPEATALVADLVDLLGPDASWLASAGPAGRGTRTWRPLTECTFDACLLGQGGGHVVVLLATDED